MAQLGNIDCCAVLLLVEKCVEEQIFYCAVMRQCAGMREENQMILTLVLEVNWWLLLVKN